MKHWQRILSYGALATLGVAAFTLGYIGSLPALLMAGVDCHKYTSATPVPEGYSAPYNVFSTARELLVTVSCDTNSATMSVGSGDEAMYVYKYGYEWRGGSWQRITFAGSKPVSGTDWLRGKGTATLAKATTATHVVGFTCQWRGSGTAGAWKCGCRDQNCTQSLWQVQAFEEPKLTVPTSSNILGGSSEFVPAYLSTYAAPAGASIALYGSGLTGALRIRFGTQDVAPTKIEKGAVWFTVPSVTSGVYELAVTQGTHKRDQPLYIAVTSGTTANLPILSSVSPEQGPEYGTVTVKGTNFTARGNYIMSTFGVVANVSSSDGTTLRFKVPSLPPDPLAPIGSYRLHTDPNKGMWFPVNIKVLNANGLTSGTLTYWAQVK